MTQLQPAPAVAQIVEGPVSADDWVYASHMLRDVSHTSPCAVREAGLRLFSETEATSGGAQAALAEAVILLTSGSVICAASVASTMPAAIDDLRERLHRRLAGGAERAARRSDTTRPLHPRRWVAARRSRGGQPARATSSPGHVSPSMLGGSHPSDGSR